MAWTVTVSRGAVLGALVVVAACGTAGGAFSGARPIERAAVSTTVAGAPAALSASTTVPPAPAVTTTQPKAPRPVAVQRWVPYASVGPVILHHPSDHVEAIGFHQSGHDGALPQTPLSGAAPWFVQEDRERDTHPHGAADIVVEPNHEVRAPVTGTVIRAGTYTLYCDNVDEYAVIEPDAHSGWEVKLLHVEGLAVRKGQRVEAGVTRLAARARVLPFASDVEEQTAVPAWPHVHVEVVDPSVPDRPTGPGCP